MEEIQSHDLEILNSVEKENNILIKKTFGNKIDNVKLRNYSIQCQIDLDGYVIGFFNHGRELNHYDFLKSFFKLRFLTLNSVKLKKIDFLKELKNLNTLDLGENEIMNIECLKGNKELSSLYLGYNSISDLSVIRELKKLKILSLTHNNISNIIYLNDLTYLNELNLSTNNFIDISHLKNCTNLYSLNISYNRIQGIEYLIKLKNLEALDLRAINLTDLEFIKYLPNLNYIRFDGNHISNPQEKVYEQGLDAIRNYFKQLDEQGSDFLYEAKIILVGEPEAGKTTLMKKILDAEYQVPNNEEKETIGITVEKFPFKHPQKQDINITAHIWDFGGQNIQYTMHQFFFTPDSLYILLLHDRKENTDYDYWFNIIRVLGEGSPVIVVLNEVNKLGLPNFDFSTYKNRYNDLNMMKLEVDFSKNDGRLEVLMNYIKENICCLGGIGKTMPKQWIPIREEMESLSVKNHITYSDFIEICNKHKLTGQEDQKYLASTFHSLGVFLHFSNDSSLFNTIFTNPQWVVTALYTILKDKELQKNNGLFTKEKIFNLWGKEYTDIEKNELISLMLKDKFDLCYKIGNGTETENQYIFPQLISGEIPKEALEFKYTDCLRFRIGYNFMPKGIFSRLIVRLSDYIYKEKDKGIVWRKGVMLKYKDCKALLKEDINKQGGKVIDIAIWGDTFEKKEFLIIIKRELLSINATFNNLKIEELVPCICSECKVKETPYFYEYLLLKKYKDLGDEFIKCNENSQLEKVKVSVLLDGYEYYTKKFVELKSGNTYITINKGISSANKEINVSSSDEQSKNKINKLQLWTAIIGFITIVISLLLFIFKDIIFKKDEFQPRKGIINTEQQVKDTLVKDSAKQR